MLFDDVKLNIKQYEIKEYYTYKVGDRTKYLVNNTGLIMSLTYEYKGSTKLPTFKDFLNTYIDIKYVINNRTYKQTINNITPSSDDTKIYISVNEDIKKADEIYLVINLRNTECNYRLK